MCEVACDLCLILESGFTHEVRKCKIDLFTSPLNTELVHLELELMGDLGANWN